MCLFGYDPAKMFRVEQRGSLLDMIANPPKNAIIGWRTWRLLSGTWHWDNAALRGSYGGDWSPEIPMMGKTIKRKNSVGVYAYAKESDVASHGDSVTVWGEVLLWGTIVQYDRANGGIWGYRAEIAYPLSFFVKKMPEVGSRTYKLLNQYARKGVIINTFQGRKWVEHNLSYEPYKANMLASGSLS